MTLEYRNRYFPVMFMCYRWDNKIGFPGGFLDLGEGLTKAVIREVSEEYGINLKTDDIKPIVSHDIKSIAVHLFHYHLGKLSVDDVKNILNKALHSKDAVAEGTPILVHLEPYSQYNGLNKFMESNCLASAVKEETEKVLEILKTLT